MEFVFFESRPAPFIVGTVGDDELDFVDWGEMIQVTPVVFIYFSASGTFEIDDFNDWRRHIGDGERTAGLQHNAEILFKKRVHESEDLFLLQRFSASDFYQPNTEGLNFPYNVLD